MLSVYDLYRKSLSQKCLLGNIPSLKLFIKERVNFSKVIDELMNV